MYTTYDSTSPPESHSKHLDVIPDFPSSTAITSEAEGVPSYAYKKEPGTITSL